jgi:hypothetical protein
MGLDLRLLPFEGELGQDSAFSHSVLSCSRNYDVFDAVQDIEKSKGRLVPRYFSTFLCRDDKYEESHYGNTQDTPYGERLKEVEVEDLLPVARYATGQNKAVWAYLAELPARTRIALYWH